MGGFLVLRVLGPISWRFPLQAMELGGVGLSTKHWSLSDPQCIVPHLEATGSQWEPGRGRWCPFALP